MTTNDFDAGWIPRRLGDIVLDFIAVRFDPLPDGNKAGRIRAAYDALNEEINERRLLWEESMDGTLSLRANQINNISIQNDLVEATVTYEVITKKPTSFRVLPGGLFDTPTI